MINRRNLLKVLPAGILGSLFPAKKLFGKECNSQKYAPKEETFTYKYDGSGFRNTYKDLYDKELISTECYNTDVKKSLDKDGEYTVHKITFMYPKEDFKDKGFYSFSAGDAIVHLYFFDKDGKFCFYDKENTNYYLPEKGDKLLTNVVWPKKEWIDREIKAFVRCHITSPFFDTLRKDIYVHLCLREDLPCIGIFIYKCRLPQRLNITKTYGEK